MTIASVGAFHEPGGNTLAIALPLGIVGDHPCVVTDEDLELDGSLPKRLHARVVGLDAFQLLDRRMAVM